jgi:tRNA-dihydrouridine synthase A
MMDRTDRHFRFFIRQLTRRTLLYSEMVTVGAVIHGDRERLLGFDADEHLLALQLGGDNPRQLATCARLARDWGYDEVDLNVGCPSDRVAAGNFGAALMAQPQVVARCVEAMREAVDIPVTVKHRIGTDALDRYEDLERFVETVASGGCRRFVVHARIAVLGGLSPKQNRSVPPLRYDDVYRLKQQFPQLTIVINGGVTSLSDVDQHLRHVDGVMIGRAAYDDPFMLGGADQRLFGQRNEPPTRRSVVEAMIPYVERLARAGQPTHRATRHMNGLFAGRPGARTWRRLLGSTHDGVGALRAALSQIPADVLDERAAVDQGCGD